MSETVAKETLTLQDRLVNVWDWTADRLTLVRILGGIAMFLGFLHYTPLPQLPIDALIKLHGDLAPELVGMGLTIWLIDWAVEQRQQQELKQQLIRDLLGNVTVFAVRAIRELKEHDWWEEVIAENKRRLQGVQWQGANLTGADLSEWDLSQANLENAKLFGARLRATSLYETNLQSANMFGVEIQAGNHLILTKLQNAILKEATLRGVSLVSVDLKDANLWGADLQEAKLIGTDLSGANVTLAQLQTATQIIKCIMPDGVQLYNDQNNPKGPTFEEWAALQEAGDSEADSIDEEE